MTQKISPEVFASAARMASVIRCLSASEIIASPTARGAAAPEGAAAPGKTTGKTAGGTRPGRARSPVAGHRNDDRTACAAPGPGTGLATPLPGDEVHDREEDEKIQGHREEIH